MISQKSNSDLHDEIMMKYVMDTSVILSGKDIPLTDPMYIPPGVLKEIKKGGRWFRKLMNMKAVGLKTVTPPGAAVMDVRRRAKNTGDLVRLSDTDIEVIALAVHLDAVILTDDYAIQNMAKNLGVSYKGISQEGITEEYSWTYRCTKCGRWYKEPTDDCRICGGEVKTVRKR